MLYAIATLIILNNCFWVQSPIIALWTNGLQMIKSYKCYYIKYHVQKFQWVQLSWIVITMKHIIMDVIALVWDSLYFYVVSSHCCKFNIVYFHQILIWQDQCYICLIYTCAPNPTGSNMDVINIKVHNINSVIVSCITVILNTWLYFKSNKDSPWIGIHLISYRQGVNEIMIPIIDAL